MMVHQNEQRYAHALKRASGSSYWGRFEYFVVFGRCITRLCNRWDASRSRELREWIAASAGSHWLRLIGSGLGFLVYSLLCQHLKKHQQHALTTVISHQPLTNPRSWLVRSLGLVDDIIIIQPFEKRVDCCGGWIPHAHENSNSRLQTPSNKCL